MENSKNKKPATPTPTPEAPKPGKKRGAPSGPRAEGNYVEMTMTQLTALGFGPNDKIAIARKPLEAKLNEATKAKISAAIAATQTPAVPANTLAPASESLVPA